MENLEIECPVCRGTGDYEVCTNNDNYVNISCPLCGGDGTHTVEIEIDYSDEGHVEVEDVDILPYVEGYHHCTNKVYMYLDCEKLTEYLKDNKAQGEQLKLEI